MSAQGDAGRSPPGPDYRSARRLILIGVLVAVASLLVLLVGGVLSSDDPDGNASPVPSSSGVPTSEAPDGGTDGAPSGTDGAPGGTDTPAAGEPPESLPGETADEYRWRAEAGDLRRQARDALQDVLDATDAAADPALRAQLERVAAILAHEAVADELRQRARASALSSTPDDPVVSSGTGAGGLTTVVGLVGALGGMITAAAGLLTAWVAWRKAARG
jgi:hypothetical protein